MNVKGGLTQDQVLAVVIVVLLITLIAGFIYRVDIINYLDAIIPVFNYSSGSGDDDSMYGEIFNENGRCKPIESWYSLNNGELESWDGKKWVNLENQLPSEEAMIRREVKDGFIDYIRGLHIFYESQKYDVEWTSFGFEVTIGGEEYVYVPDGTLNRKEGIGLEEIWPEEGNELILDKDKYPNIVNSFKAMAASMAMENSYSLDVYYNRDPEGEQSVFTQPVELVGVIFVSFTELTTMKTYGVDSDRKFYTYTLSERFLAISDWGEVISEDLATTLEANLFRNKQELLDKC